jgi:hypothetical protein
MSVSAVKALLWLASAAALTMLVATASAAFDRTESLALCLGACVLIVGAVLWYRRVIPEAEAREQQRQDQQRIALKQQLGLTGEPILVKASSGLPVVVLLACVTIFCGRAAFTNPGIASISLFAVTVLLTLGIALIFLPGIGRPALTIRPDGLETAVLGLFRWEEIESIGLQRYTSKAVTSYSLDLYVPQLRVREDRLHPVLRAARRTLLRGSRPNFVVIHLALPSLPATLVHALCHDLWKERTGRSRVWTSVLGEHRIAQMRRGDEHLELLKQAGETAQTDPAAAMQLLEEIEKRFGDRSAEQKPKERLGAAAAARRDALLAELRTIDARDQAAVKNLLEKHAAAHARDMGTKLVVIVVALVALMIGGFALFG